MCSCGSTNQNNVVINRVNENTQNNIVFDENCEITSELLNNWKQILLCIKNNIAFETVGLSEFNINSLLGIIQSAINYPDNYCYYSPQLENFKNNILLRIVENVPECINQ